ncbi:Glycosyl phosphatidyl inositol protein transamidase complex subunit [Rhodotorula kratochvilovae]
MASRLKALLRRDPAARPPSEHDTLRSTLIRRQKLVDRLFAFAPHVRTLLILAGLVYTLALPYKDLGRKHYISENALQPGHVNTYWNWADVHVSDINADKVAQWSQASVSTEQRSRSLETAFQELGLSTSQQRYTFELASNSTLSGINTYAILPAPKTDGAEALVLSASWLSYAKNEDGSRRVNTRGVALVLALANYFKKHSMWSKDIIFVISDGYADGAQAWLDSYHGVGQSNLRAEPLRLTTGAIWAALNLDYPHHSFSHIGIYYEGANGHLPNLDFINSASRILRNTGIPTLLHSYDPAASALPSFLAALPFAHHPEVQRYVHAARNLFHQVALTADGRILGPEGAYGKYRIDAITLHGLPAEGPHGFHLLGRAVESLFRSLNNLLERFHQSFFLYLMTSVDSFVAVGNYLAAPILLGAGLTIQGLIAWGEAGGKDGQRERPIARAAAVLVGAAVAGAAELRLVTALDPTQPIHDFLPPFLLALHLALPLLLSTLVAPRSPARATQLSLTLRSSGLLLSGLLVSTTATLNFGLSLLLALYLCLVLLPTPLSARLLRRRAAARRAQQLALAALSPAGVWVVWRVLARGVAERWARNLLRDWAVGGGWSLPLAIGVVGPLGTLAAVAGLL